MGLSHPDWDALFGEEEQRRALIARTQQLHQRLRDQPELLPPEQWAAFEKLVGPEWASCWVDADQFRSWSAQATKLLRALASTPLTAFSDIELARLVGEIYTAVEAAASLAGSLPNDIPHLEPLEEALRGQAAVREAFAAEARAAGEIMPGPRFRPDDPGPGGQVRRPYTDPGGSPGDIGGLFQP